MSFKYKDYKVIVCIDFGSLVSGACYCFNSTHFYPDIISVTNWPGQSNHECKTPSTIIYGKDNHLLYWGRLAQDYIDKGLLKQGQIVKDKFKLDFPSSVLQKKDIYKASNAITTEVDSARATIDYLREIFDHTVSAIQNGIGFVEKISAEKEDIRFVITVPAQWNDVQRAIMRTVAKEAGLITDDDHENRLLIINESSAATLYCEVTVTGYGEMKAGDKHVICDAGGYTVDLTTFESVENTYNGLIGSHRYCQLAADSGNICGSTFVDQKMRELLTRMCYGDTKPKDKEEEKMRDKLLSPAIDKFKKESKVTFGLRSENFKFPPCKHKSFKGLKDLKLEAALKKIEKHGLPFEACSEGDPNDGQCLVCKLEDYRHLLKKDFGKPTIVKLEDGIIVPTLKVLLPPEGVTCEVVGGTCKFTISYDIMRKLVFNNVIKSILHLIDRQIKKANGDIDRTYLVGGFGCSPYLRKMILREFRDRKSSFPAIKYSCGKLIIRGNGESEVLRGAMLYGINNSRRKPETGVYKEVFSSTDKYNTLICLDIGYDSTSCSYRDFGTESDEMTHVTSWPGSDEETIFIPTAKQCLDGKTLWGAQIDRSIDFKHDTLVLPSELMSSVKPNFRSYLREYLQLVLEHVYKIITKENPHLSDKSKYRYVITMENCYQFFSCKSEMRIIAQLAGIVSKEDPCERLLLINRNSASAMYNEKQFFSKNCAYTTHFLQISIYHDACHLSLFKSTKVDDIHINLEDHRETRHFGNVRCLRSVTFDFNFINRSVSNLNKYLTENYCIECSNETITCSSIHYPDLRKGFVHCIKTSLDLRNNDEIQYIQVNNSGCCIVPIKVYNLLEFVFYPAIRALAYEIDRFAKQSDMVQFIKLENIFLSGTLLQASKSSCEFLNNVFVNNIFTIMNIPKNIFKLSEENGKEALLGAEIYGNCPESFTERVSRRTYAVNVRAFAVKEFPEGSEEKKDIDKLIEKEIASEIEKGCKDEKKNLFHAESIYFQADLNKPIPLSYQSPHNPYMKDEILERESDELSFFNRRGDKIYEKDGKSGIFKKFYAAEISIAYITIYCSDTNGIYNEKDKIDEDVFRKIHQFEVYLKYDEEDPLLNKHDPRFYFSVHLFHDDNEARFEVRDGSRLGNVPDFYYRDEFLVSSIYDDRQHIHFGDLGT